MLFRNERGQVAPELLLLALAGWLVMATVDKVRHVGKKVGCKIHVMKCEPKPQVVVPEEFQTQTKETF